MRNRNWTDKEECYLRKFIYKKSIREIAGVLKRSYNSVLQKAIRLGIYEKQNNLRKEWTQQEEDYLYNFYYKRGVAFIAKKLNRTEESVKHKAQTMGLNAYCGEEFCVKTLARAFNSDSSVVNRWIEKFNLPCRKIKRGEMLQKTIDSEVFWKWAGDHKDIIPFNKYERYSVLPEPYWVSKIIQETYCSKHREKITNVEKSSVKHLREKGKTFKEIAQELNRTEDSVKHIWRSIK